MFGISFQFSGSLDQNYHELGLMSGFDFERIVRDEQQILCFVPNHGFNHLVRFDLDPPSFGHQWNVIVEASGQVTFFRGLNKVPLSFPFGAGQRVVLDVILSVPN